MKSIKLLLLVAISLTLFTTPSFGQFPEKPITYTIPFGPGGQSDLEARRQQPLLENSLGQKIIIQYKAGGGGSIGWAELVKKKPDGYFITGINIPHIILQPLARGNAGFETEQIVPVALFQATPIGLAVLKDSEFTDLDSLINYAKKNPGMVTAGGSGTWSGHHIAHLQLGKMADANMTYIPSKGAAESVAAFLGGHVKALWANSNDLVQHADKIRVLAYGTKKPFEQMSDVPTFESLGYKIYASIDRGVAVPPGTPADVIEVLEKAFLDITNNPEVQTQMRKDGFQPVSLGHKESMAYIAEMKEQWTPIVQEFNK